MFRKMVYVKLVGNAQTHECKSKVRGPEVEVLAMLGTTWARRMHRIILEGRYPANAVDELLAVVKKQMLYGVTESEDESNDQ